jgi:MFS family permease
MAQVSIYALHSKRIAFIANSAYMLARIHNAAVILLFFAFTVSASVLALLMGKLSDKVGRKSLLVSGYIVFSVAYLGFAFAANQPFLVGMFLLFGAHTAMISGAERAFVAEIAPSELKGTLLGLKSTVAGIALLPANILAGVLWDTFNAAVPFAFGAAVSLLAALILIVFLKNENG